MEKQPKCYYFSQAAKNAGKGTYLYETNVKWGGPDIVEITHVLTIGEPTDRLYARWPDAISLYMGGKAELIGEGQIPQYDTSRGKKQRSRNSGASIHIF